MLREYLRFERVKATKVIKRQRATIHHELATSLGNRPGMKIPISDIVGAVTKNQRSGKQRRSQIDPLLVGKQTILWIDPAGVFKVGSPPVEKLVGRCR